MLDAWGWIGKGELGNYSCNFHWEFTFFPQSRLGALGTSAKELIAGLNPLLRSWREYYQRALVRRLFHRLDHWIRRRIRSYRCKHWRNAGWTQLPMTTLYGEYQLVRLFDLIPSLASRPQ